METPVFFTRDDDQRFGWVTWLLILLECKAKDNTCFIYRAGDIEPLLGELVCLTNILARNHEEVAIMLQRDGRELFVLGPQWKGSEGTSYTAKSFRT